MSAFVFTILLSNLLNADEWEIMGNFNYNSSNDEWYDSSDSMLVLSDYQWYDVSNSFNITYTTSIDLASSVEKQSGLLLFNGISAILCESHFIGFENYKNGVEFAVYRFANDKWHILHEVTLSNFGIYFANNRDYIITVTIQNGIEFTAYLDDVLLLTATDNDGFTPLTNGYSGFIGFLSEEEVSTTIKSLSVTGHKMQVTPINVQGCNCDDWQCTHLRYSRSQNVLFPAPIDTTIEPTNIALESTSINITIDSTNIINVNHVTTTTAQYTTQTEPFAQSSSTHNTNAILLSMKADVLISSTTENDVTLNTTSNLDEAEVKDNIFTPYDDSGDDLDDNKQANNPDVLLIVLVSLIAVLCISVIVVLLCTLNVYQKRNKKQQIDAQMAEKNVAENNGQIPYQITAGEYHDGESVEAPVFSIEGELVDGESNVKDNNVEKKKRTLVQDQDGIQIADDEFIVIGSLEIATHQTTDGEKVKETIYI